MILGEHARACEEIDRLVAHPQKPERGEQVDMVIRRCRSKLNGFGDPAAAKELEDLVDCGLYDRKRMAKTIALMQCRYPNDPVLPLPLPREAVSLVHSLATVRGLSKRDILRLSKIETWDQVFEAFGEIAFR